MTTMKFNRWRIPYLLIALLLFGLEAGCAANSTASKELPQPPLSKSDDAGGRNVEYLLQPGDVLDVKLYYNTDLNEQVRIRPDGRINLQLIDEIKAAGLTIPGLKELLTEKYAKKLRHPELTVIVRESASQKVYVGGEVNTPGLITYTGSLTALQAIFQAGGLKNTAELATVVILRDQAGEKPIFITRDLTGDLAGEGMRNDLLLMPYDIVFLPKTTIAKMNLFVDQYIEKLIPISKTFGFNYVYSLNPSVSVK